MTRRVLILGAAGRDFHHFNVAYRESPDVEVVGFTATQIPNISDRRYPPELAGARYPEGLPIFPEDEMEKVILGNAVDTVVFAYSDVPHEYVMHLAARAVAVGASFEVPATDFLESSKPVVAITAVRTGAGKSPASRKVRSLLAEKGLRVGVVRHPMAYGDLYRQRVQRFASYGDLAEHHTTIEEREEYEHHLEAGSVVYAGVDYGAILALAEDESDVVLWDGGNNDLPFFRPDLWICIADPHRPDHGMSYWPGEANLRAADVILINKIATADPAGVATVEAMVGEVNPDAIVIRAESPVTIADPDAVAGKRVLVLEDGPTITHGEMSHGAGVVAAEKYGAGELVDPRPFAVGSIAATFERFPHIGSVLPAMGYGEAQMEELRQTIEAAAPEVVLVATPIDLARLLDIAVPSVRATYTISEIGSPTLSDVLTGIA
jgi:predicted GTPase